MFKLTDSMFVTDFGDGVHVDEKFDMLVTVGYHDLKKVTNIRFLSSTS